MRTRSLASSGQRNALRAARRNARTKIPELASAFRASSSAKSALESFVTIAPNLAQPAPRLFASYENAESLAAQRLLKRFSRARKSLTKSKVTLRSFGFAARPATVALFFCQTQGLVKEGICTNAAIGEEGNDSWRELNM